MIRVSFCCQKQFLGEVEHNFLNANALSVSRADGTPNRSQPHIQSDWEIQKFEILLPLDSDLKWIQPYINEIGATNLEIGIVGVNDWRDQTQPNGHELEIGQYVVGNSGALRSHPKGIVIDSTLAFGTGLHPTTQLCLEWMSEIYLLDKTLLDVGCGSGILSIAAVKSGCSSVKAIDNDEDALATTKQNARTNQVTLGVDSSLPRDQTFDVVIANIVAITLIDLSDDLSRNLKQGGNLALSGIRESEVERVIQAFHTIRFGSPKSKDGWFLLRGEYPVFT